MFLLGFFSLTYEIQRLATPENKKGTKGKTGRNGKKTNLLRFVPRSTSKIF